MRLAFKSGKKKTVKKNKTKDDVPSVYCHIVGLTEEIKHDLDLILLRHNKIKTLDIDYITYTIFEDDTMCRFRKNLELYTQKCEEDKQNRANYNIKCKDTKNKMILYWKTKLSQEIKDFVAKNKGKKIVAYGLINYPKIIKTFIELESTFKIFLKINNDEYTKKIIKYYLDNESEKIINGTFDLSLLDPKQIIKKKDKYLEEYIRKGYIYKSFKNVIKLLRSDDNGDKPDILYVALPIRLTEKIEPFYRGNVIGFENEWEAELYFVDSKQKHIDYEKKNKLIIINVDNEKKINLHKKCYVYLVSSNTFVHLDNGKYISPCAVNIMETKFIKNIHERINTKQKVELNIRT